LSIGAAIEDAQGQSTESGAYTGKKRRARAKKRLARFASRWNRSRIRAQWHSHDWSSQPWKREKVAPPPMFQRRL